MDNLEGFKACFKGCDELVILPVWSVAEEVREIDFAKEFTHYNTTLCAKISTSNGMIKLINEEDEIVRTIESGIVLGVGAGDITYQLRHKRK